ncbi:hypothetical protein LEP1GSC126_1822 [Leptospira kirschneri str. 200801774]|nr:hypothetical protein LEP1GSC126_1822 [Leptospira kirschneri str. 200801774]
MYESLHFQNLTVKYRHVVVPTFYFLRQFQGFVRVPTYIFSGKTNFRKQIPYTKLALINMNST